MVSGQQQNVEELPVTEVSGITPQLASRLEKLGIFQIKDLLFHFPIRYQNRTEVVPLGSLDARQTALISGQIASSSVQFRGRRSLIVRITDGTGSLYMRLFHFNMGQKENLVAGRWIRCFGEVRRYQNTNQMIHPEYSVFRSPPPAIENETLTPVYRLTEGVVQQKMRSVVASALNFCAAHQIPNLLPPEVLKRHNLPDIFAAIQSLHTPPSADFQLTLEAAENPARQRLIIEELTSFQVARRKYKQLRQSVEAPPMIPAGDLSKRLKESLSFQPTNSQIKVIHEVLTDLKKQTPMLRLVQGDVGSGKTLIASAAAAWVVDSGFQAAIMAPTELLAEQHFKTFTEWFEPLGIKVLLLTGRLSAKERRIVEYDIRWREANIVIGTHALFQQKVEFNNLGLVVIDEQHRFGVGQRFALREKGVDARRVPHQLIMTATPIPRTLAMTMYADLDVSSITELPPNRIPVKTAVLAASNRRRVVERMRQVCAAGQQAYWVCPIIEKSETLDVEAATEAEKFVKKSLPELKVALVHGRIKTKERDEIMSQFRQGKIDVLVATTVIEVGVDVPNASFMVIESAERLGLAQLHQLRGRVGRGTAQAQCQLLYKGPLSAMAKERLAVMRRTTDGFEIAETDLKLRGAGELLGTRQTGAQLFRIAELPKDLKLLNTVNEIVDRIVDQHLELAAPLIRRWAIREGSYSAV